MKLVDTVPIILTYHSYDLLDSKSDGVVFPIHENWKDIGNPIDFREAVESFK